MRRPISRLFGAFRTRGATTQTKTTTQKSKSNNPILRLVAAIPWAAIARLMGPLDPRRLFRKRKRPAPIIRPYVDFRRPLRRLGRLTFPVFLTLFCLVYGFFFALTAPYLLLPFAAPVIALMLLAIWALPDAPHTPTRAVEFCFMAVIVSRVLWPNYLALQLPGLPWITMLRLAGFPMAFLLLICLSTSRAFRADLNESFNSIPGFKPCLIGFVLMEFLTIPLSQRPATSTQLAMLDLVYMFSMVSVGALIGRTPGRVSRYINLLLILSVPIMVITIIESKLQKVLWVDNIPSFLKIEDPAVLRAIASTTRGVGGLYRAKATFGTALGLAEYLAILTPFFIHVMATNRNWVLKIFSGATLIISFYCIFSTHARLGVVGYLVSILVYTLVWGIGRHQRSRTDIVGATVVYGYPAIALGVLGAVLSVHRLRVMVLGGGETAGSNAARQSQLTVGIPKILTHPLGHGMGESGNAIGAVTMDFVTVDNYYLTVSLDLGIPGLILFFMMFFLPVLHLVRLSYKFPEITHDDELSLILPISASLCAFMVIKLVFSEGDGHMLLYAMLGMSAALASRIKQKTLEALPKAVTAVTSTPLRRPNRPTGRALQAR